MNLMVWGYRGILLEQWCNQHFNQRGGKWEMWGYMEV